MDLDIVFVGFSRNNDEKLPQHFVMRIFCMLKKNGLLSIKFLGCFDLTTARKYHVRCDEQSCLFQYS